MESAYSQLAYSGNSLNTRCINLTFLSLRSFYLRTVFIESITRVNRGISVNNFTYKVYYALSFLNYQMFQKKKKAYKIYASSRTKYKIPHSRDGQQIFIMSDGGQCIYYCSNNVICDYSGTECSGKLTPSLCLSVCVCVCVRVFCTMITPPGERKPQGRLKAVMSEGDM